MVLNRLELDICCGFVLGLFIGVSSLTLVKLFLIIVVKSVIEPLQNSSMCNFSSSVCSLFGKLTRIRLINDLLDS